jgi:hypothetical protein
MPDPSGSCNLDEPGSRFKGRFSIAQGAVIAADALTHQRKCSGPAHLLPFCLIDQTGRSGLQGLCNPCQTAADNAKVRSPTGNIPALALHFRYNLLSAAYKRNLIFLTCY